MAEVGRRTKGLLRDAIACKVAGICEREKILNAHIEGRFKARERALQTFDEITRADAEIPRCPPECGEKEVTVIKHTEIIE